MIALNILAPAAQSKTFQGVLAGPAGPGHRMASARGRLGALRRHAFGWVSFLLSSPPPGDQMDYPGPSSGHAHRGTRADRNSHNARHEMANFQARQIIGKWKQGFALDLHTLSSTPIGHNEFGHMQFNTQYSEVGELLYKLKYKSDQAAVNELADAADRFVKAWKLNIDIIVPVPASTARKIQPVALLASALSQRLNIPVVDCVKRTRDVPQLKNVRDLDERMILLADLHAVDVTATQGKRILLFDDLYRSGATMNAITTTLYEQGKAADVFALTITQTRSYR